MTARNDLAGQAFGLLTAQSYLPGVGWLCTCACGGTITRSARHLNDSRRRDMRQSCGCNAYKGRAIRWAFMYRGELRSIAEASKLTGMSVRALLTLANAGRLTEAHLDERAAMRARVARAKANGINSDALSHRLKLGWDEERACTEPMRARVA